MTSTADNEKNVEAVDRSEDVDHQKVPKSSSSSSGVNEISDSSNNSTDEYIKRMEEVAEREKAGEIPTFRDIMDLLKFAYILQQTDLKSGDLNSVPKGAHELWSELKESLIKRPVLQGCYNRRQTVCNCCDNGIEGHRSISNNNTTDKSSSKTQQPPPASSSATTNCGGSKDNNLSQVHHVAKREMASHLCSVDDVLGKSLDDVLRQGLLDPLVPYLTSISANTSSGGSGGNSAVSNVNSSVTSGTSGNIVTSTSGGQRSAASVVVSGCSAAESSSKEEEGDLSRAPSVNSLNTMPSSHRMASDDLLRRTTSPSSSSRGGIKKSDSGGLAIKRDDKKVREVTIHVCDETRDAKKDFTCPQDLLLSQMGYFRDITSGQSLEDVDISVHCDVTIFEWLMDWLKAQAKELDSIEDEIDPDKDASNEPELTPNNVVSILVSASFLKMGPLVDYALVYLHQNMNKVLVTTHNLNCLGEPLLTRLSHLYKPTEVEELMDRRDRIHSRLYTKLICSLCEPEPQPDREIFQTAATLHRCKLCGMYLTQQLAKLLPCHPLRSMLNRRGEVVPKHQRDPNFNLNDFLKTLRSELKSWRKVFWRVWGMCHALYCSLCSSYFPVYLHEFCSFHPQDPEFPGIQFKNSTQPFGAFSCCQMPIFRFQPLPANQKGCQSRDHRVKIRNDNESKTYKVLMANRDLICLLPTRKTTIKIPSDATSITLPACMNKDVWHLAEDLAIDLALIPSRKRRGLVNRTLWETLRSSVIQGVLKKAGGGHSLFSAVQAARANLQNQNNNHDQNAEVKAGRVVYGRLKRAPKLPSKPALQSSESSTDDLSGSEDSSSSGLDDADNDHNNEKKEEASKVSILSGNGTEDDDVSDQNDNKSTTKSGSNKAGDLCIEIKLGKDNDKTKTLLAGSALRTLATGIVAAKAAAAGNSSSGKSGGTESSSWMRWDSERSNRANQDYQREREEIAMRDLLRHLARRQQHLARQQGQAPHPASAYMRPINSAPNLTVVNGPPFGGAFLRLEQDWRETHMAYLQHRSAAASAQNSLTINTSRMPRPNSAASLRSARHSRINRH